MSESEKVPKTAARPAHLPDFSSPPLNEVVLGVQFSPPKEYQQIYAGKVWDLFQESFPKVQEQPPLPQSFETFGISHQRLAAPQILFDTSGPHNRYWFLTPGGDELIQFQQDRMLHNWRKIEGAKDVYPRFEVMAERFRAQLEQLQNFVASLSPQTLNINQAEVSYINHILLDQSNAASVSDWLRIVNSDLPPTEDVAISVRDVVRSDSGTPLARFTCDAATGVLPNGNKVIVLNLTVRGAPVKNNIDSALDFLKLGRDVIVTKFAELTTEKAHQLWGRIK